MPMLLENSELEEAIHWMSIAVNESANSPCQRDKRGVVIVKNNVLIGKGVNAPPEGFICEPEYCESTCKTYAVHAEMNAIIDAVNQENDVRGARMYQARAENGDLIDSRKPRCAECSKHIILFGIADFVLKHKEGYTLYTPVELNKLSLNSLK